MKRADDFDTQGDYSADQLNDVASNDAVQPAAASDPSNTVTAGYPDTNYAGKNSRAAGTVAAGPSDTGAGNASPEGEPAPAPTPRPQRYTRERPAHRTVEPIDDLQADEDDNHFTHDSDYANRGSVLSGRSYRRSRSEMTQLRRDLHYGQYLEIPKGRRDIFASRERKSRIRSMIALVVLIIVLAVVVYFVWTFMQTNWGATG